MSRSANKLDLLNLHSLAHHLGQEPISLSILSKDKYKENNSHFQTGHLWSFASAADWVGNLLNMCDLISCEQIIQGKEIFTPSLNHRHQHHYQR